jgi:hypothetical protein
MPSLALHDAGTSSRSWGPGGGRGLGGLHMLCGARYPSWDLQHKVVPRTELLIDLEEDEPARLRFVEALRKIE